MDFFSIIGMLFVSYILIFMVLLIIVDCNIGLLWYIYFGKKLGILKSKVIWVTGASSGIGEYLALEFSKNGAKLILTARSQNNLERVKNRCIKEGGAKEDDIAVLPFDITKVSKHKEIFEQAISCFGKLEILVNNAGRSQRAQFEDIEISVDREMFELNTFAAISLSRLSVKYFQSSGIEGHIVVMSSGAGLFGFPYSCSYNGSKHALHGYFKTLSMEKIGSNLNVTLLCPGPVFSNFLQNCFTNKSGEIYGQEMDKNSRKMKTDRCAYLAAVAIANQVGEAWIGLFPCLPLMYITVYHPIITKWIFEYIGEKSLMTFRDGRQTITKEE